MKDNRKNFDDLVDQIKTSFKGSDEDFQNVLDAIATERAYQMSEYILSCVKYECKVELYIKPSSDIEKLEESLARHIEKWIDEQTEEVAEKHWVGNFYEVSK